MAAYLILTHTISNRDRYRKEFIPQVFPFITKHEGEVIVNSFDAESLQGDPAILPRPFLPLGSWKVKSLKPLSVQKVRFLTSDKEVMCRQDIKAKYIKAKYKFY